MIKTIPYCGINGHINPPERIMALAREMEAEQITVAPLEGSGNYTIPPLAGWKIIAQRAGRAERLYFDKEGISMRA